MFIGQFIKMGEYSELKALQRFSDLITLEQFGLGRFVKGEPSREDIAAALAGLARTKTILESGQYKLVIMEEANVAAQLGLLSVSDLVKLILEKPRDVELVITGRGASPELVEVADLVTEMKMVKHYFEKGVRARVGIEK